MKRKVLGILFVSTVFMTSWCGCGNGNTKAEMQTGEKGYQKIELVMAVNGTDIQIDTKVADKFAELVAEETNGNVTISVFPNDQLAGGNASKGIEMIAGGGVDLAAYATSVLSVIDRQLSVGIIPWSFADYEEAKDVIDSTGYKYYEERLDAKGLTYMGVLRTLPNMTVIMPADYYAAKKLVAKAAEFNGPVYLRFTRDAIPVIYDEDVELEIGKAHKIREGKDISIIANGDTVCIAMKAAEELEAQGISVKLLDMHTIKPLDVEAVKACIADTGKIITVEDHNIINGLGSAVCEVAAEYEHTVVKRIGIQDQFGQSAPYERLLEMNGITAENIVATAKALLK